MAGQTETISFRLPADLAEDLSRRAAARHRRKGEPPPSRNDIARSLVIEGLADTEREHVRQELATLRDEMAKLREDLATATVALLVNGGKSKSDEAKEWVRRNLLS